MNESGVVLAWIHPVTDFDNWRDVIKSVGSDAGGTVIRRRIFRSQDDPNDVMVLLEMTGVEAAQALVPSLEIRELLDRAGMDIYPPVFLGMEVPELRREQ